MKFPMKLIPIVVAFLAVTSLTPGHAVRMHTKGVSSGAPPAPSTETLFKQKCTKCHGADGSGDTSLGRIFGTPDFTDSGWWAKHPSTSERVRIITRGKKNMPAFGRKLTKAQIAALAAYVQRFQR